MIANTPKPPYYAVIFTSLRTENKEGYNDMGMKMYEMVQQQPGFLGAESVGDEMGITVSYWETIESIANWKSNMEHREAQEKGKSTWYKNYKIRICKVERDYGSPT